MVLNLAILAIAALLHVHDSLDVARLHLHHNRYAHVAIDKFQLVDDGTLGQILNAHVDGGHDIGTVHGRGVHDVKELVEHLPSVYDAILATKDAIVAQLQTEARRVLATVHRADGTTGCRPERALAGVVFLNVKTAAERRPHDVVAIRALGVER